MIFVLLRLLLGPAHRARPAMVRTGFPCPCGRGEIVRSPYSTLREDYACTVCGSRLGEVQP